MNEIVKQTVLYFQSPSEYFWRWAEKGDIVEWITGKTICFRDDLVEVLKGFNGEKLPPLSSVLLLLAACNDSWKESNDLFGLLRGILRSVQSKSPGPDLESMEVLLHDVVKFLDLVNNLPNEFRIGPYKTHLFNEIFSGILEGASSTCGSAIINEFSSGRQDHEVIKLGVPVSKRTIYYHLDFLRKASKKYSNVQMLEMKLKTGLEDLPKPAQLEEEETDSLDLLRQLEQDIKTQGIARLTRALIVALNIPMHANHSSDLSFGGFSDITNRGTLDKLLLSELAQEDAIFTARLVNNEAMFLRREEPPGQQKRERVILIDSSIRLWGIPRILAISAGLGCALNNRIGASIKAYLLGSKEYIELDLESKRGIINWLGQLDPGINCFKSLREVIKLKPQSNETEYVFITEFDIARDYHFNILLAELECPLSYLITVSRQGGFQLLDLKLGRMRPISSAKIDLDDLLFSQPISQTSYEVVPAYLLNKTNPLFFPTTMMVPNYNNSYFDRKLGVIAVNDQSRVLYWSRKDRGARELLERIEKGDYCFGGDENSEFYVLVTSRSSSMVKFYKLHLSQNKVAAVDLSKEISKPSIVIFSDNCFYIKSGSDVAIVDCGAGGITDRFGNGDLPENVKKRFTDNHPITFPTHNVKHYLYNSYSVPLRFRKLQLDQDDFLCLDDHKIKVVDNVLRISTEKNYKGSYHNTAELPEVETLMNNTNIKFRKYTWADGSLAFVDLRGFLHLKSSDPSLPEITMVLIIGKSTACWASDGAVAGYTYFADSTTTTAALFYKKYFQPFIDRIRK